MLRDEIRKLRRDLPVAITAGIPDLETRVRPRKGACPKPFTQEQRLARLEQDLTSAVG